MALCVWSGGAEALREVELGIGAVSGPGWSSGALTLALRPGDDGGVAARLHAAALGLPGAAAALREATLECAAGRLSEDGLDCPQARLRVVGAGGQVLAVRTPLSLSRSGARWRIALRASGLVPATLRGLLGDHWPLPGLDITAGGTLAVAMVLSAGGSEVLGVDIDVEASGLGFSDADGLRAGEGLRTRLRARLTGGGGDWHGRAELAADAGGLYVDPVFLDLAAAPLRAVVEGRYRAQGERLEVSAFELAQDGVARLHGTLIATLADSPVAERIALELEPAAVDALYRTYLQPFLFGGALGALSTGGEMAGRFAWQRGEGAGVHLRLDGVDVEDEAGRFAAHGVDGVLDWDESGAERPVWLAWSGGSLYRLALGAARVEGVTAGRDFYLERALTIPVLDGAVDIQALEIRGLGGDALTWEFRGGVRALSMQRLTAVLGWPTFGGTVSGSTPRVRFAGGVVQVDGELGVRVFDGGVRIRGLSVRNPLGLAPVLRADVAVEDISLHALTGAFSFGNIHGGLSGHVHGLVLEDWQPTAFDAAFATPEDDDSPHRISQRAVRNLTRLGGAGAVLSSTVLGLFEEFSYRRLGLACRLRVGVCEMAGLADAPDGGFFIVEGGGLPPRIDVLGFNRRVDWAELVTRAQRAIEAPAPVVR